jgi:ABC-type multidrug transport system ATPase subunit
MRQRLGLAQGILADPPLLVLDEPSVGLDPHVAAEFRDLLAELNAGGTTIVITSHLLGEVERLADRVAILKDGLVVALDTIPNLLTATGLSSSLWIKPVNDITYAQAILRNVGIPAEAIGATLKVAAQNDSNLIALDTLREQGVTIESFWTTTPTLEEVFRRVVERKVG